MERRYVRKLMRKSRGFQILYLSFKEQPTGDDSSLDRWTVIQGLLNRPGFELAGVFKSTSYRYHR